MSEIEVNYLDCTTEVANELLDVLASNASPQTGLTTLDLCNFDVKIGNIDMSVLDILANKCNTNTIVSIITDSDTSDDFICSMSYLQD